MRNIEEMNLEVLNENFNEVDEHMGGKTSDADGVHGLRYNETDKTLEVLSSGGVWITIK
ncbi:MAG: hypothetical protein J6D42_11765 [Clostridia bacterium]|nr:hypothetical protein [Clostridia bacterium]